MLQPLSPLPIGGSAGVTVGVDVAVVVGVGAGARVSPISENVMLNVTTGVPAMMSVPMRNQSGAKSELRIQACKSPVNGVPGATIGFGADRYRKSAPATSTWGRKN